QNEQYINQKLNDIKNRNFDIKPSKISLPATTKVFDVTYLALETEDFSLKEANETIILKEPKERVSLITNSKLLQQWLQIKAVSILEKAVETNSKKLNIPYNKIKIGSRKSIWGSCSHKKNINLNRNLLFLEPSLIKYVVTHELCHIHEMNHSKQFWYLLNEVLPGSQKLQRQLKSVANSSIPSWALI
ncbi:MAG TPA: M48 family metallopeptidase, partial [SAR202 cluster bacterium]|nr:M48 family metallopeptidase [SAR202 cluster bacterium]